MRHFEDFVIGERWEIDADYEMTRDEIVSFASKWDPQSFHINDEAAKRSVHGVLTASGTHTQAVVLLLAAKLPHVTAIIGAIGYDEVRFPKPVRLGDRLRLAIECIEKRESASKPDRGVVKNRHTLTNQNGEIVFTQVTTLLIKRRARTENLKDPARPSP